MASQAPRTLSKPMAKILCLVICLLYLSKRRRRLRRMTRTGSPSSTYPTRINASLLRTLRAKRTSNLRISI